MSTLERPYDAVVVGGGIAGLTAASELVHRGRSVALLERAAETGGAIRTVRKQGFLIEEGPNSLLDTSPAVTEMLDRAGIAGLRVFAQERARKRYVVRNGRPVALPMSPGQFLSSQLFSWKAKLRLLREPFVPARTDGQEESVAGFVERRLGQEFLDYAINPFVAGVYAGDPRALSVAYAFPKLDNLEREYGSLIKGQIRGRRERQRRADTSKNTAKMYSFDEGLAVVPDALARLIGNGIMTSTHVDRIERAGTGWLVRIHGEDDEKSALHTQSVVYTGRVTELHKVLKGLTPKAAGMLGDVTYPPVAVLGLGYRAEQIGHPLDGFGVLVPEVEKRSVLGVLFSSSIFEGRAPEGHHLLTVFVGGKRQPDLASLDQNRLLEVVSKDLRDLLEVQGEPVVVHCRRWPEAIPQYEIGYGEVKSMIRQIEKREPGLFLAGNYRGGISVPDTVVSSREIGARVEEFLQNVDAHVLAS